MVQDLEETFQTTEGLDGFPEVRSNGHRLVWTAVPPSGRSLGVWSWGAFLLNKRRSEPPLLVAPQGPVPWNKGRGLGLLRAGPPASLDGTERRD